MTIATVMIHHRFHVFLVISLFSPGSKRWCFIITKSTSFSFIQLIFFSAVRNRLHCTDKRRWGIGTPHSTASHYWLTTGSCWIIFISVWPWTEEKGCCLNARTEIVYRKKAYAFFACHTFSFFLHLMHWILRIWLGQHPTHVYLRHNSTLWSSKNKNKKEEEEVWRSCFCGWRRSMFGLWIFCRRVFCQQQRPDNIRSRIYVYIHYRDNSVIEWSACCHMPKMCDV